MYKDVFSNYILPRSTLIYLLLSECEFWKWDIDFQNKNGYFQILLFEVLVLHINI